MRLRPRAEEEEEKAATRRLGIKDDAVCPSNGTSEGCGAHGHRFGAGAVVPFELEGAPPKASKAAGTMGGAVPSKRLWLRSCPVDAKLIVCILGAELAEEAEIGGGGWRLARECCCMQAFNTILSTATPVMRCQCSSSLPGSSR